jgi:tetratricopeptide (TPR) repeat protein
MMHTRSWTALASAVFLLLSARTRAQQAAPQNAQAPVYIVDFTQALGPELEREFEQLNKFTSGLIQLRVLQIPSLTVHRVQTAVACGAGATAPRLTEQTAETSNTAPVGDFYLIEGSIKPDLPQITLSYSVRKCEGNRFKTVLQDAQPFTLDRAFDQIAIVADAIAFKIERVTPPTQVDVTPFSADVVSLEPKGMTSDLQNAIAAELQKSPGYEVAQSADYKVVGQLTFQRQHLLGTLPGRLNISAEIQVMAHGKTYPLRQVRGSGDQLQKFYQEVSDEIARGLPEVLIAEHLHLSGMLESMKTDELLTESNRLLQQCSPSGTECASAQDAVKLLADAAHQDSASWRLLFEYGKAQALAGRSGDAIPSLKEALRRLDPGVNGSGNSTEAEHVQVLNELGGAYRNAGSYDEAVNAYTESVQLDSSQIPIYKDLAEAFEFKGQRGKALETLITGFKMCDTGTDCDPLHSSAKSLILSVPSLDEIQSFGKPLVDAREASLPVNNEYALFIARKWSLVLDNGLTPQLKDEIDREIPTALNLNATDPEIQAWVFGTTARLALMVGDSARVHKMVASAEHLSADQVPANLREWIERIAAQDFINTGHYEQAIESADRAYHILPSDTGTYLIANASLMLARCKERAWKAGHDVPTPEFCLRPELIHNETPLQSEDFGADRRDELEAMYADVTNRLAPLVSKRFPGADYTYMRANHSLDKDHLTLDQFRKFTQQDATDLPALDVVIYVCSEYLFDFDCAFSAASREQILYDKKGGFTVRDYLNISEAAVLNGNGTVALKWLGIAASQKDITAGDQSLLHLYRLWTMMLANAGPEELKGDFDEWRDAARRFRESSENLGWIFDGAKTALNRSGPVLGEKKVALLTSMIDSLEHREVQLPTWPSSGQI